MKKLLLLLLPLLVATKISAQQSSRKQQKNRDTNIQSIERNAVDNSPTSIIFSEAATYKKGQSAEIFQQYFGLDGINNKVAVTNTTVTKQLTSVERYEQYYKGIKIEQGVYTILYNKDDNARFMNGNLYIAPGNLSTAPAITEQAACAKALAAVNAEQYAWQILWMENKLKEETNNPAATHYPTGELVWIEDNTLQQPDRKLHLAYKLDVYAIKPLSREHIYIDAVTGKTLHRNSLLSHTNGSGPSLYSGTVNFKTSILGGVNKLRDSTRGGGINTYSFGNTYSTIQDVTSASTTWASDAALDAHWGAEKVYDYWLNEQGRNSYNNAGAVLNSYVHYGTAYDNAYWDGVEMVYGDGTGISAGGFSPLTAIDVCAHEIGHAVCQFTANLAYNKESGAMNEGLSDIWGAIIEEYANPYESDAVAKNMWKIGEEISANSLRRMDNPNLRSHPDTYGGTYWVNVVSCSPSPFNDYCGVHTNSSVLNHWFYLLCTGGSGTNDIGNVFSVTGIGTADGADIVYQTELLLTPTATYANCRTASISAAITLYGACSPQVRAVTKAWYAVGVGTDFTGATLPLITGNAGICLGSTTTLANTTSGGTWSSSNTSIATVGSTGIVTSVAMGTSLITYAISGGCFATRVVTVFATTPTVSTITGTSTVCVGNSVMLSNTTSGGIWSSTNTSVANIDSASGMVSPVTAGPTTISYTVTNACGPVAAMVNVTINTAVSPITGFTTMYISSPNTFGDATPGGTWSSSNNSVVTIGSATGVATGTGAGTANITYATSAGCYATQNATVNIPPSCGISTYAGIGTAGYTGDGGPATATGVNSPWGVAIDATGNMYIGDASNNRVRKITPSGVITTVAGTGTSGFSGDGSPATIAQLNTPSGVAVDGTGNIYVADNGNRRVRKIDASGIITTLAGTGTALYTGDGGPATAADIFPPDGVAADNAGNVYISSAWAVRKISPSGIITRIAGNGTAGYSGDGGPATAAQLQQSSDIKTDTSGNVYFTDFPNHCVRKISSSGIITTIAGTGVAGYSGDSGPATSAKLNFPVGIDVDNAGNVYIGDRDNDRIRKVTPNGQITTIAGTGTASYSGDGGDPGSATINKPHAVTHDVCGNIYFCDRLNNRIRKIVCSGTMPATSVSGPTSVSIGAAIVLTGSPAGGSWSSSNSGVATAGSSTGIITGVSFGVVTISYTVTYPCGTTVATKNVTVNAAPSPAMITWAGNGTAGHAGDGGPAASAKIYQPYGVDFDPAGNLYIADYSNVVIRKVNTAGIISTIAGTPGSTGSTGDGGPATAATLNQPIEVKADASGNVYVTDFGSNRIRKINSAGIITTIAGTGSPVTTGNGGPATAAGLHGPIGVNVDNAGNIYIVEYLGHVIRKINAVTGIISTIAGTGTMGFSGDGGPATAAQLKYPHYLHIDFFGNIFFSDMGNQRVRKINTAGIITTVAGNGSGGFSGDGGQATGAQLFNPQDVQTDAAGNIYISDYSNHRIRKVSTAGVIATIAGTGFNTYYGDCGPATAAWVNQPVGLAIGPDGDLLIGDMGNNRVRKISTPVNVIGTLAICAGGSTVLSSSAAFGIWTSSNTSVATIGSTTGILTGISSGTSNIVFNSYGGCSAATVVTVNAGTAMTISGPGSVVVGTTITLTSSASSGTWSSSNISVATIGSTTGIVTGVSTGIATITYSTGSACNTTVQITVNSTLSGVISGANTVCIGGNTTFLFPTPGGVWTSSNPTLAMVNATTGVVTGVAVGTPVITYTIGGAIKTKSVTVVAAGTGTITGNTNICVGSTSVLSYPTSGTSWTSSNTAVATIGATSGVVTGISAGTSQVSFLGTTGCGNTAIVNILALPNAISGTLTFCQGTTSALSSAGTAGGTWQSSNTSKATVGFSSGIVSGVSGGTAVMSYTWTNTCKRMTTVTVNPVPVSAAIVGAGTMSPTSAPTQTLAASQTGGTWASGNVAKATIVPSTGLMTAVSAGTVVISYTRTNGCGTITNTRIFSILSPKTGEMAGAGGSVAFSVYPNPTSGFLTIETPVTGIFSVYSIDGRQVASYTVKETTTNITLPKHLASGVYMCRFYGDDGKVTIIRLVYEH